MQMIHCLELADADHIVESAKRMADQLSARVSIAVVDASGCSSAPSARRCFHRQCRDIGRQARTAALTGGDSAAAEQAIGQGVALLSLQAVLHQPAP